ncbi:MULTISPECIES: integration host factor subunit alpha [Delftia]|uniref:Integration host factor subunit alpha n=1 Tax=Delftia lacustris TaxID=558537 RepID=A0A1H3SFF8_9BURK|nr:MULTISPECIES: integration host factor subunit alpha [Delftia]EPD43248.1 integration host factor, alpha subunit [Delftia acidovorans CCUG 274B]PZP71575.1 MAG: integration host factor subunit alpha [Delftia acidovorans]SDZ36813.1 integration host factor subunit alpha [Delftia lacustris]
MQDHDGYSETPSLNKAKLSEALYEQIGLNKREAGEMVDAFFAVIAQALAHDTDVKLTDFGAFELRWKQARPGRNPRTGEHVKIGHRRIVTFRAGPKLKQRMNHLPPGST